MKIRKNDDVIIIAGKDKGKNGKVLACNEKTHRIQIAGINMIKKHVKPSQTNPDGGIQEKEG
jgi:large subunit ribosomal protein L24